MKPALAAKVSIIPQAGTFKGNLFLNNGKGSAPIVDVTEAHTGDTLMASGTGRALVVYDDGCKVEVSSTKKDGSAGRAAGRSDGGETARKFHLRFTRLRPIPKEP